MPSKQDIAIAKGLAKEAGKMVAEELAKMLIPGIGWFTGLVSVVKLIKALNDPGDESRPVELALRVPQDARFCVRAYQHAGRFLLDDFFNVELGKRGHTGAVVRVGYGFDGHKKNMAGEINGGYSMGYQLAENKFGNSFSGSSLIVGFNRDKKRDLELISTGPDTLVAQAILAKPQLKQYETEMLAGAAITVAALKVSAAADLFDTDMKPNFSESKPAGLIDYGEALANYASLVKSLGTYPAGVAAFGDPISYTVLLGDVASKIAKAFGLEFGADFVTFKSKFKTEKDTIRGVYQAQLEGAMKQVPGTSSTVNVSMPGSPLDNPAATPPAASLPQAIYTIMPVPGGPRGPSVITTMDDGRVITSRDLKPLPIQNTLAPSITKPEQQLGKLGLVENVSTAGEPGTKPAGATDRSVLVLVAAAAALVALS